MLDGDSARPPQKGGGATPQFSAHVYSDQTAQVALGVEVGLGPGHIVLDWDSGISQKGGRPSTPNFRPMSFVAKLVSDIAIFVLKRDVKLQLTNFCGQMAVY